MLSTTSPPVTVRPKNTGDGIMMSGAYSATRCASSNGGAYCAAGTANIGSSAKAGSCIVLYSVQL